MFLSQDKIIHTHRRFEKQLLCLYQQYFMQTIEGPRNKINELHKRLLADERHHDLEVVEFSEIDHLTWNRWAMDIASSSSTSHMILKHYLKPIGHNAYLLTCAQAQDLLRALGHQTRAEHDEEA